MHILELARRLVFVGFMHRFFQMDASPGKKLPPLFPVQARHFFIFIDSLRFPSELSVLPAGHVLALKRQMAGHGSQGA